MLDLLGDPIYVHRFYLGNKAKNQAMAGTGVQSSSEHFDIISTKVRCELLLADRHWQGLRPVSECLHE